MYVLCDHSTLRTYRIKVGDTHFDYDLCAHCGLDPDTPPITSTHEGELLPWWDWKPTSGAKITRERPGINRVQAERTAAREQVLLLQQLVALEEELGESDPRLAEELQAAKAHRASLGYVFATH